MKLYGHPVFGESITKFKTFQKDFQHLNTMNIDFENGGGLYVLNDVRNYYFINDGTFNFIILFSGVGGSPTLRDEIR